ncbi:MAG: ATP-binding protein [Anaerolineae bacterium]|nr:ATP-binding protein [Anaerolineae bacterium]
MTDDPRQLVVLSGKGGTGKTSVAAAFAHLASQAFAISIADADVDAANLELVLDVKQVASHEFQSGFLAHIDPDLCISCGQCYAGCYFDAIIPGELGVPYRVDPTACEGCGACQYRCPVDAIAMLTPPNGLWYESVTRFGPLYHAHLFAGGENSGKLVTLVKQQARLRALDEGRDLVLVDGPPGIGCPVISAASGASLALLVVEPTLSGVHDLRRVLDLVAHFDVPAAVMVNKADLSGPRTQEIRAFCRERHIPLVGEIPYDTVVTEAMVQGVPVTEFTDGPVTQVLSESWTIISDILMQTEATDVRT